MPTIYCDHNFLVTAHEAADGYKDHLRELAGNGGVTFVLSPMHWVEAAEDGDAARGDSTADFMDSLGARWIYDRRTVQRKEVSQAFFRFAGIPDGVPQMTGELSDVVADLAGRPADRSSRAFVARLRCLGTDHPLERNLAQAFETNQQNTVRFQNGEFTSEICRNFQRQYIEGLLPATTPGGVVIDAGTKRQFLDSCQVRDFPAIALEMKATHHNWRYERQLRRNNFMDQQHLISLPYADFFLTDDARLRALIRRISAAMPFQIATLLTKADFDLRYS